MEQRVGKSTYWRRITKTAITTTTFEQTEVAEGEQYDFRVIAENLKGPGAPSEASERVKIPTTTIERKPPKPEGMQVRPRITASPAPGRKLDRNRRAPSELSSRAPSREKELSETIGSDFDLSDEEAEMPEFEENMSKPQFVRHLEDTRCTEGELATLQCEVGVLSFESFVQKKSLDTSAKDESNDPFYAAK